MVYKLSDHLGTERGDTIICNICGYRIETLMDKWYAPGSPTGVVYTEDGDVVEELRKHRHPDRKFGNWRQEPPSE